MYKSLFLAATLVFTLTPIASAQGAGEDIRHGMAGGSGGATRNESTWGNYYGDSGDTGNQGGVTNGLLSPSIPGLSSQSATGAPIPGTFIAPANLALRNQGQFVLPRTNLDSFVAQSGYDDLIYGDEGVEDIPPYFNFTEEHRIERGIERSNPGLTTGHRSDAPAAWGWPF
jgi:hypothetical protein